MPSYNTINTIFPIIFIAIIGIIVFTIAIGIAQWNQNNHSQKLTVRASVVSKRTSTTHYPDAGNSAIMHTRTTYYVTFEAENKNRMEFLVNHTEYESLTEGDTGELTFQGTRYFGFR